MRAAPIIVALALTAMLFDGCRGESDRPPVTPSPATGGQALPPLTTGRDVTAPDGRYALRVPADWLAANAPVVELSYRSPDIEGGLSLTMAREELAEIRRPQAYAEAGRRDVSELYRNVITLSLGPVQIGDREGYRWVYTATTNSGEFFIYQLYLVDGAEGFVMTGLAPITTDFADAQRTFDSIAGSITFARG